jgi:hypothetical protein
MFTSPVSIQVCSGGGGGVKSVGRGDCEIARMKTLMPFAPSTSKNSTSELILNHFFLNEHSSPQRQKFRLKSIIYLLASYTQYFKTRS